jgi:hypothetical protein
MTLQNLPPIGIFGLKIYVPSGNPDGQYLSTYERLQARLEVVDPLLVKLRQLQQQQPVRPLELVLGRQPRLPGLGSNLRNRFGRNLRIKLKKLACKKN